MSEYRLPAENASVRLARGLVQDFARSHGAGPDSLRVLELLTSEVVTNALRHATLASGVVVIRVHANTLGVTVEVEDDDPRPPQAETRRPGAGGLGVRLVAQLALTWGAYRRPRSGGMTVWFTVAM